MGPFTINIRRAAADDSFVPGGVNALQLPAPFEILGYSIVILAVPQLSAVHVRTLRALVKETCATNCLSANIIAVDPFVGGRSLASMSRRSVTHEVKITHSWLLAMSLEVQRPQLPGNFP
jgi:hypothetical protein